MFDHAGVSVGRRHNRLLITRKFEVVDHYEGHLGALKDYAQLWRRTDGSIGGEFHTDADVKAVHDDPRLTAKDTHKPAWARTEYLVLRMVE